MSKAKNNINHSDIHSGNNTIIGDSNTYGLSNKFMLLLVFIVLLFAFAVIQISLRLPENSVIPTIDTIITNVTVDTITSKRPDINNTLETPNPIVHKPEKKPKRKKVVLSGQVREDNDKSLPIEGIKVRVYNNTVTTNLDGYFYLEFEVEPEQFKGTTVSFTGKGYFQTQTFWNLPKENQPIYLRK